MVGEAVLSSNILPGGGSFVPGSIPVVAPTRQPPGVPLGGIKTLQPSLSRPRSEAFHFGVKSGLTATR